MDLKKAFEILKHELMLRNLHKIIKDIEKAEAKCKKVKWI